MATIHIDSNTINVTEHPTLPLCPIRNEEIEFELWLFLLAITTLMLAVLILLLLLCTGGAVEAVVESKLQV
jgi:hypothetical protein